jgi:hypothetical protein
MQLINGRPVVDMVYVNGHGPFRFLVDTGANVNLIAGSLARKIGMEMTFKTDFASVTRQSVAPGSTGNEISLDSARAFGQEFLLTDFDASQDALADIQGLLGQAFLSRFDYVLDLKRRQLTFGAQNWNGTRSRFRMINGRPSVSTSLGELVLDSGAPALVVTGVKADIASGRTAEMRTAAGSDQVALCTRRLVIEGRKIWQGDAVVIPHRLEPGVDGLLPLRFFKTVYVSNSGGFLVLD